MKRSTKKKSSKQHEDDEWGSHGSPSPPPVLTRKTTKQQPEKSVFDSDDDNNTAIPNPTPTRAADQPTEFDLFFASQHSANSADDHTPNSSGKKKPTATRRTMRSIAKESKSKRLHMSSDAEDEPAAKRRSHNGGIDDDDDNDNDDDDDDDLAVLDGLDTSTDANPNSIRPYFVCDGLNNSDATALELSDVWSVPSNLAKKLYPFQRFGVKFMHSILVEKSCGMLCDDTGLGKTVQVAALASALFLKTGSVRDLKERKRAIKNGAARPMIIAVAAQNAAALTARLQHWQSQLDEWGYFTIGYFVKAEQHEPTVTALEHDELDIVLTNADNLSFDNNLHRFDFSAVIMDGMQFLSATKRKSIQKRLADFSVLGVITLLSPSLIMPGDEALALFTASLSLKLANSATKKSTATRKTSKPTDSKESVIIDGLSRQQWDRVLLRWRADVANQLPKVTNSLVLCSPSSPQAAVYNRLISLEEFQLVSERERKPCPDCSSNKEQQKCCRSLSADALSVEELLFPTYALRMSMCNSASQFVDDHALILNEQVGRKFLRETQTAFRQVGCDKETLIAMPETQSGKFSALISLLQTWQHEVEAEHKIVVLVQSDYVLLTLARVLKPLFSFGLVERTIKPAARAKLLKDFSEKPSTHSNLLLVSANTATALLLPVVDTIVLFEPLWYDCLERGTIERVLIVGQRRSLRRYFMLTSGGFDSIPFVGSWSEIGSLCQKLQTDLSPLTDVSSLAQKFAILPDWKSPQYSEASEFLGWLSVELDRKKKVMLDVYEIKPLLRLFEAWKSGGLASSPNWKAQASKHTVGDWCAEMHDRFLNPKKPAPESPQKSADAIAKVVVARRSMTEEELITMRSEWIPLFTALAAKKGISCVVEFAEHVKRMNSEQVDDLVNEF